MGPVFGRDESLADTTCPESGAGLRCIASL